jgi:hypothetical protein
MGKMNGYKVVLFQTVYHNDKFSHNIVNEKIVNAKTEKEAIKQIELKPAREYALASVNGLKIKAHKEVIYRVEYLGYLRWKKVAHYIKPKGK